MLNWLGGLLGERRSRPRIEPALSTRSVLPSALSVSPEAPDPHAGFIEWLLDTGPTRDAALDASERQALQRLDERLADGAPAAAELLTRVPAGIPQLLSALRQEDLPVQALSEQIGKDLLLTAEVLRLAASVHYRPRDRPAITDLSQAVTALGRTGVQQAVARVLLRPMFDVNAGPLTRLAATRLWEHAERKAGSCAALAASQGIEPFEGYLAGLAHNSGWSAAWRILDRDGLQLALPCTLGFAREMVWRRDRLFGALVSAWQITPALTALGAEARHTALGRVNSPLGPLLLAADLAASEALRGAALPAAAKVQ